MLRLLFGYEVVQIVTQEIGTVNTSMSIEHTEVGCFFPVYAVLRLGDVEYDCNSVLVILSYGSLIGGGGVCFDVATGILGMFGRLEVGDGY